MQRTDHLDMSDYSHPLNSHPKNRTARTSPFTSYSLAHDDHSITESQILCPGPGKLIVKTVFFLHYRIVSPHLAAKLPAKTVHVDARLITLLSKIAAFHAYRPGRPGSGGGIIIKMA